jgi:hypothetical protein
VRSLQIEAVSIGRYLHIQILAFDPLLALQIQQIMCLAVDGVIFSAMARQILIHRNFHVDLLKVCWKFVSDWICLQLLLSDIWNLSRVDWDQLVLLLTVPYKAWPPRTIYLLEEEAEAAIWLHVDFDVVHCEPLSDARLQIGDPRVAAALISVVKPWYRCMMKAPRSMPS